MSVYTAVKKVAYEKGKSIYRIERDLGLSNGYISKWNKSMPGADKLQAVADYLGVTPQYLLYISEKGSDYHE
ncbi:helix-turn-helix domain-containing protein [Limosilactobacillus reuteri]|uniref:Transcriptional regulator, XRE family n=1 Tax=Limosilactobacillus reuteri subsp. rodentium (strain DSM 17509 / CIP 109821 / 100-23) TaxID=349123 RepID=B3XRZ5_LIMR1|nr:helix-turn-helix transcriptional regulator [Limosilactobacillus reuteri]EDX41569.1 transcriptional regulator, XRE family [Limosilactobacillus reuteri subsp. rodentium]MCC4475266.1 helix-turn-helix domain-containing protein [Limosilactobacillus reuteri]